MNGKSNRQTLKQVQGDARRGHDDFESLSHQGKLPPQAIDLEEAVLGAVLLEKHAIYKVANRLQADMFYLDAHRDIWEAVMHLYLQQMPLDILTVTQELKKQQKLDAVGGAYYITKLTNRVSSAANIEFHSMIVIQKYVQRELIRMSGDMIRDAFDESADALELLDRSFVQHYELHSVIMGQKGLVEWGEILDRTVKELEERGKADVTVAGITTGSATMDRLMGGWQNGNLYILAARTGMGKTARFLNFMKVAAMAGKKVLMFSIEMTASQLAMRMISEDGSIDNAKFLTANLDSIDWNKINMAVGRLSEMGITVVDKGYLTINDISTIARMRKVRFGLDMIGIDYLQLIRSLDGKGKTRDVQLGEISMALKALAKELDVPIIPLVQVGREVEKRANKRPVMSDMRESGNLEQDADFVGCIYRPGYYYEHDTDPDYKEDGFEEEYYKMISELIIAKNRFGPMDCTIMEKFWGQYSRFEEAGGVEKVEEVF
jgi:replicative DNA helicase